MAIANIQNKMPKAETLRKYYPNSLLTDVRLLELAEFVRAQQGGQGVSPDNKCLKMLIQLEERRLKEIDDAIYGNKLEATKKRGTK